MSDKFTTFSFCSTFLFVFYLLFLLWEWNWIKFGSESEWEESVEVVVLKGFFCPVYCSLSRWYESHSPFRSQFMLPGDNCCLHFRLPNAQFNYVSTLNIIQKLHCIFYQNWILTWYLHPQFIYQHETRCKYRLPLCPIKASLFYNIH